MFLCIDSDTRHAGIACAIDGRYFVDVTDASGKNNHELVASLRSALSRVLLLAGVPSPEITIFVETPQLYLHGTAKRADILKLAVAAGIALGTAYSFVRFWLDNTLATTRAYPISPKQWKGDRPKLIHQRSVCEKKGWVYEERKGYIIPRATPEIVPCSDFRPSDYKHIMDAIGMCVWAEKLKPEALAFFEA